MESNSKNINTVKPEVSKNWETIRRIDSKDTNVSKYVFEREGEKPAVAEAVLYRYGSYETRTVICCSTQSGCPIGCRFCGAGDNFVRSLTADEIVSQSVHLIESNNIDTTKVERMQIMFMSMGEPALNQKNLCEAIVRLHALYPRAALLISTSAPDVDYEDIMKTAEKVPTVGLQFSVHESTDEARNKLIPFAKKLILSRIAEKGDEFYKRTGRTPFFNYCAHDKNTSDDDVNRLNALFNPGWWQATVSVICERDESIAAANERQRSLATGFMSKLLERGYSTRTFDPAGQDDIGGGCGQLWFVQNWMKNHPEQTRNTVGHGLPKVHTPTVKQCHHLPIVSE